MNLRQTKKIVKRLMRGDVCHYRGYTMARLKTALIRVGVEFEARKIYCEQRWMVGLVWIGLRRGT